MTIFHRRSVGLSQSPPSKGFDQAHLTALRDMNTDEIIMTLACVSSDEGQVISQVQNKAAKYIQCVDHEYLQLLGQWK